MSGWFDMHAYIGNWPYWPIPNREPAEVLALMDRWNIRRAAVCSLRGVFLDWTEGNEDVLRFAAEAPERIVPVVTVSPYPDQDHVAALKAYAGRGARGVGLFPVWQGYTLDGNLPEVRGMLLEANECRLVVHVCLRPMMNWGLVAESPARLEDVARLCPDVPVVASGVNYGELRPLLALAERYDNIRIELSALSLRGAVEQVVERLGISRLLFGTGLPLQDPGPVMAQLQAISWSPEELQAIASRNAEELYR